MARTNSNNYQATYRRKPAKGYTNVKPWKSPRNDWDSIINKLNASSSGKVEVSYRSIGVANTVAGYVRSRFDNITVHTQGNTIHLSVT